MLTKCEDVHEIFKCLRSLNIYVKFKFWRNIWIYILDINVEEAWKYKT